MSDKPAMNTLKKTFTAMLSRIGGGRVLGGAGAGDTSGSDNISVNSRCVECLSRYRSSFLCVVLRAVSTVQVQQRAGEPRPGGPPLHPDEAGRGGAAQQGELRGLGGRPEQRQSRYVDIWVQRQGWDCWCCSERGGQEDLHVLLLGCRKGLHHIRR